MIPGDRRIELTDPKAMRALAHPVRLALLETLGEHGPLTATQAAEHVGESPSSCSFHLRQLAKYGLVEEAGGGHGRERPWRKAYTTLTFSGVHPDRGTAIAAGALERTLRDRYVARMQSRLDARPRYAEEWQAVTGASEYLLHVTPEELRAIDDELTAALMRYRERHVDPALRPEGSLPVEVLLFAYPVDS